MVRSWLHGMRLPLRVLVLSCFVVVAGIWLVLFFVPDAKAQKELRAREMDEKTRTTSGCDQAPHYLWKGKMSPDADASLKNYLKAIELCPGYIRPYELAGNLYRKQGRLEEAIRYFEKAAQLGTVNYKLYHLMAALLFKRGDLDDASRCVGKALRIRPDYTPALELRETIEKALDKKGPKLVLYEPSTRRGLRVLHGHETLTVRGLATDQSGVSWVKVNGRRASLDEHGNFLINVPIHEGQNTILVKAFDLRGNLSDVSVFVQGTASRLPELERVETPRQGETLYGKSYGVVIGINRYEKWPALEFAAADARAVHDALLQAGFDDVTLILDEEATQRRILTELFETLPQKTGREDRVVFYFAGHGQTEDLEGGGKQGYIVPVDAGRGDYPATALSMGQIRSLSRRIPAKHILYVMDSCYSGLGFNRSAGLSVKVSDYLRKISGMRVVQIITAGGKGEQVQEREGHGLFTNYFLKALNGEADLNGDNVVTGTELGAYLRPAVSNASGQEQTPLYGRLEGEGEFLFFVPGAIIPKNSHRQ